MKQVIYGRFGATDTFAPNVPTGARALALDLVDEQGQLKSSLGQIISDSEALGLTPSELGLDLLVLAAHIYAADTRISRARQSQDNWTREIRVIVPVSNPAIWTGTIATLAKMLNFLSGDIWTIEFRNREQGWEMLVTPADGAQTAPPFSKVQLFSGGLDSLVGTIDNLHRGETLLLISHAGDGVTSNPQNTCFTRLKAAYSQIAFDRLRMWLNVPSSLFGIKENENTTRGRSFLFFALGIFAGTGLGQPFVLETPENGLIALNVPLDILRLGSLSTHTTHPYYMVLWNQLLREVGIPARVENPYWVQTKGEMVASCTNQQLLQQLIPESLSCSSPAKARWTGRSAGHCGYCLPCLIRRASISHAGIQDLTQYTLTNLNTSIVAGSAQGKQIRSFQVAAQRLTTSPNAARWLIHKSGPLPVGAAELIQLASVYAKGISEVARLLLHTSTTG